MKSYLQSLAVMIFILSSVQFTGCSKEVVKSHEITKLSDAQITLAVFIQAQEGKEAELRKALIALIEPTRKEKGCINFVLHTDPADNGRFLFYENWENKKLWEEHLNSPHIMAFGNEAGNLVANKLDLTNWKIYE